MEHKRKLKLNIKFKKNKVVCARSSEECKSCKDIKQCEEIEVFYYPYSKKDIKECFKNNDKKR